MEPWSSNSKLMLNLLRMVKLLLGLRLTPSMKGEIVMLLLLLLQRQSLCINLMVLV